MLRSHHTSTLTLEEQRAWSKSISQRLDDIYKELCEYEQVLNEEMAEEPMHLMELLETVNDLQTTTAAIRSAEKTLKSNKSEMQEQMHLLQKSVELLKLDRGSNKNHAESMEMPEIMEFK